MKASFVLTASTSAAQGGGRAEEGGFGVGSALVPSWCANTLKEALGQSSTKSRSREAPGCTGPVLRVFAGQAQQRLAER